MADTTTTPGDANPVQSHTGSVIDLKSFMNSKSNQNNNNNITITHSAVNNSSNNSTSIASLTPQQQNEAALHLIKKELLRVQTLIDKEMLSSSSSTATPTSSAAAATSKVSSSSKSKKQQAAIIAAATPYNDIKSLENYLLSSTTNNNPVSISMMSELTLLLWKKFDQLQSLRGVPTAKKWIPLPSFSSSSSPKQQRQQQAASAASPFSSSSSSPPASSPLDVLLFEEANMVKKTGTFTGLKNNNNTNYDGNNTTSLNASQEFGSDNIDGESEEDGNNTRKNKNKDQNSFASQQQFLQKELEKAHELLQGKTLIRSPSIRPETIRAIVSCCQLDAQAENTLRQSTGALQRQRLSRTDQEVSSLFLASSHDKKKQHQSSLLSPAAVPSSFVESLSAEIDLDTLLRRACATIETFASELAHEKSAAMRSITTTNSNNNNNRRSNTPTAVTSPNINASTSNHNARATGASTPSPIVMRRKSSSSALLSSPSSSATNNNNNNNSGGEAVHRMLLPPMTTTYYSSSSNQDHQQQQDSASASHQHQLSSSFNNINNNNNFSSSGAGLLEGSINNNNNGNSPNVNNKRVNDILERERRQHAIESSQMDDQVDRLSRKIDALEDELERTHEYYKKKAQQQEAEDEAKIPSQQNELAITKTQLMEMNDTCSGLQKVRKEESKRSLQIISDLEKQVAEQQGVIDLRELELDRLKAALESFIDLHLNETQQSIFEHESKTEFAEKKLYLHEKSYPHSLVVENHQLREKLFESQCQSDEREKSLALTQQKLRDVKEQLQVSDAEASTFVSRLKTSREWRELTLAAEEETAAVVNGVINHLFDERKKNIKQQEDAQASRFRMLELRLGEEVISRRQKNVQNLAAPDEAEKLQKSYQEQVSGLEEIVLKRKLNKKSEVYFFKNVVNTNNKKMDENGNIVPAELMMNDNNNSDNNSSSSMMNDSSSSFSSTTKKNNILKMKSEFLSKIVKRAFLKRGISLKELKTILGMDFELEES